MMKRLAFLAALTALPLLALAQPYAGKTVTIIVGYKAGGG
jgi:tripartite-type tricarboxylate transporter receptor subunit TctC